MDYHNIMVYNTIKKQGRTASKPTRSGQTSYAPGVLIIGSLRNSTQRKERQSMEDFKITLNERQKDGLKKAGFEGMAEDTDSILFYTFNMLDVLESHNKNYTKDQYNRISALKDIFEALYKGF